MTTSLAKLPTAAPEAEPPAPECPFCGDEFTPDCIDYGVAFGICHRCSEMVAVDL